MTTGKALTMTTLDEYRRVGERLRNWGRWGADDQLGTLNHIDAEAVVRSAGLVKKGAVFPLGINFADDGVWPANFFRRNPIHVMTVDGGDAAEMAKWLPGYGGTVEQALIPIFSSPFRFADDMIIMALQAGTQWDALSHAWYDGLLYNGVPQSAVTSRGATRNSIDQVDVKGITGRGVLIDVARSLGKPHVDTNHGITPAELDAAIDRQGVDIRRGDIVLVRTGWWPQLAELGDGAAWRAGSPGLSWTCAEWLHRHDIAAVACDNVAVEASEQSVDGMFLPLHGLCLRDMGLMLGELWNLEGLGADCEADGTYEFQLIAPPLKVTGAVGSPLNPIALK
jgi:kynurenine formamidase